MKLSRNFPQVILIIILCLISRLPQLLSSKLILDGDECVVGLMAKHIFTGNGFPIFFYGQAYGFSLVECLAIIPFYATLGICTLSVKLAMLLLWTTGVIFMHQAFMQINKRNRLIPLFIILVFIFSPAWAVWSMKARGGYLTSFMLTSLLLFLLLHAKIRKTLFIWAVMGVLFTLIYESQPIWIPGLIPLFIYQFFKERSFAKSVAFLVPSCTLHVLFSMYARTVSHFYDPHPFFIGWGFWENAKKLPNILYSSLHGNYYLADIQKANLVSAIPACAFIGLIIFLPIAALNNLATKRKDTSLFNSSVLPILFTITMVFFTHGTNPRYLLPITGYTLLSLMFFVQTISINAKVGAACTGLVVIPGIISLVTFKDYEFIPVREKQIHEMITYLISNNIHYVYSRTYVFPFFINFYSNEQVICREYALPGRYPPYAKKIDSALHNHIKTAFIGIDGIDIGLNDKTKEHVAGFYIVVDPQESDLRQIFIF